MNKNDQQLANPAALPNPAVDPVALASVFADEHSKQPEVMFPALATAGFRYCSVRFFNLSKDASAQPVHVEDLNDQQVDHVRTVMRDHGLNTTSLGGRIGKVRFSGSKDKVLVKRGDRFEETSFADYLSYCQRCFEITKRLETKLYRLFPFYAPEGGNAKDWEKAAVECLGRVVELAAGEGLLTGVETEANLIAADGHAVARVVQEIGRSECGVVFDAGNMRTMGYSVPDIVGQFVAVLPYLIWFHIKDYNGPVPEQVGGHIEEDLLKHFVPCDVGEAGHVECFQVLRRALPILNEKMQALQLPGFFLELEPHVRGGGQFGGVSGSDGIGIALRALQRLCGFTGITLPLRRFEDILASR